eukprot:jgi/Tetstr1/449506/TSEL_036595.t2
MPLPESLAHFLQSHGVDPSVYDYCGQLPRYIRLNPRHDGPAALRSLEAELGVTHEPVPWLPGFYKLPGEARIASSAAYRTGAIHGIDAASGAAVAALDPQPGEHILELCTAPGGKLCMIADTLDGRGSATGVDNSQERLAACRSVVRKYRSPACRLFRADGTTFSEPPPRAGAPQEKGSQRSRARKRSRAAEAGGAPVLVWSSCPHPREAAGRALHEERATTGVSAVEEAQAPLYDRVLVDVECTHDGSIRHIAKFQEHGWGGFEAKFLSRLGELGGLQRALLRQGFAMLRPGGTLVYSTCSMTRAQNEDVVEWLLVHEPRATTAPIQQAGGWPCTAGGVPHSQLMRRNTA